MVIIEELECKYENIELIFFDLVMKGFLNVVFIILIFDESYFLDDSKKIVIIVFYFELMM